MQADVNADLGLKSLPWNIIAVINIICGVLPVFSSKCAVFPRDALSAIKHFNFTVSDSFIEY